MNLKVKGITSVQWGISYFEVRFENAEGEYVGSIDIPLEFLKKMEITKTLNGTKKLRTWLESNEGQQFAKDKLHRLTMDRKDE